MPGPHQRISINSADKYQNNSRALKKTEKTHLATKLSKFKRPLKFQAVILKSAYSHFSNAVLVPKEMD